MDKNILTNQKLLKEFIDPFIINKDFSFLKEITKMTKNGHNFSSHCFLFFSNKIIDKNILDISFTDDILNFIDLKINDYHVSEECVKKQFLLTSKIPDIALRENKFLEKANKLISTYPSIKTQQIIFNIAQKINLISDKTNHLFQDILVPPPVIISDEKTMFFSTINIELISFESKKTINNTFQYIKKLQDNIYVNHPNYRAIYDIKNENTQTFMFDSQLKKYFFDTALEVALTELKKNGKFPSKFSTDKLNSIILKLELEEKLLNNPNNIQFSHKAKI